MKFKDELAKKYHENHNAKLNAIVAGQMDHIKGACIRAVENVQPSVDFELKDDAANSLVGKKLEQTIAYELGLSAKYVCSSDRDYTHYYIQISGWANQ